jgi:excisionase family DNA binding protein
MNTYFSVNDNLFNDVSPLLTTTDVATCLGVSKPMVRQLVKDKHLTPVRIGSIVRYSQAELKRFIESGGINGSK